jgi:hypothetical protein
MQISFGKKTISKSSDTTREKQLSLAIQSVHTALQSNPNLSIRGACSDPTLNRGINSHTLRRHYNQAYPTSTPTLSPKLIAERNKQLLSAYQALRQQHPTLSIRKLIHLLPDVGLKQAQIRSIIREQFPAPPPPAIPTDTIIKLYADLKAQYPNAPILSLLDKLPNFGLTKNRIYQIVTTAFPSKKLSAEKKALRDKELTRTYRSIQRKKRTLSHDELQQLVNAFGLTKKTLKSFFSSINPNKRIKREYTDIFKEKVLAYFKELYNDLQRDSYTSRKTANLIMQTSIKYDIPKGTVLNWVNSAGIVANKKGVSQRKHYSTHFKQLAIDFYEKYKHLHPQHTHNALQIVATGLGIQDRTLLKWANQTRIKHVPKPEKNRQTKQQQALALLANLYISDYHGNAKHSSSNPSIEQLADEITKQIPGVNLKSLLVMFKQQKDDLLGKKYRTFIDDPLFLEILKDLYRHYQQTGTTIEDLYEANTNIPYYVLERYIHEHKPG